MAKILHRYILRELSGPFFLILSIFLFVLLMGRLLKIVEMIVRQGVGPGEVLRLVAYLVPSFLPLAIPMATLIAGVICFSRLSAEMEITAMKASGISVYQMLPPVLLFSGLMSGVTLFLTIYGAPWGAYGFRELAFQMAKKHIAVAIKEGVFNELAPGFIIYADKMRVEDGLMERVFIHDENTSEVPVEILAAKGRILAGPEEGRPSIHMRLENGTMYQVSTKERKLRRIEFDLYELRFQPSEKGDQEGLRGKRAEEWGFMEIVSGIKARLAKGKKAPRSLLIELHRRLALPLGCLIYGILALPLALQSGPRGRSHGFLLGMTAIITYYLMFSGGKTLAETGILPPWLGIWGTNVVFAVFTGVILVRTARERPLLVLVKVNALIDAVLRMLSKRMERRV